MKLCETARTATIHHIYLQTFPCIHSCNVKIEGIFEPWTCYANSSFRFCASNAKHINYKNHLKCNARKGKKTKIKWNAREKKKQTCFNRTQERFPVYSARTVAVMSSQNWDMARCAWGLKASSFPLPLTLAPPEVLASPGSMFCPFHAWNISSEWLYMRMKLCNAQHAMMISCCLDCE